MAGALLAVRPWSGTGGAIAPVATTAAQLAETMNDALRAASSLKSAGTLRTRAHGKTSEVRFSIAQDDRGDFRLDTHVLRFAGQAETTVTVYRRRSLVYDATQHALYERESQPVALGPDGELVTPTPGVSVSPAGDVRVMHDVPSFLVAEDFGPPHYLEALDPSLLATIRAALATRGGSLVSAATTATGSPAWAASVLITWPPDASPDAAASRDTRLTRALVVVDQKSGLVSELRVVLADGTTSLVEYSSQERNVRLPLGLFRPRGPAIAVHVATGFSLGPFDSAARQAGLEPLAPTFVLSGFRLSEAAVGRQLAHGGVPDATGLWQVYRCGLESYVLRQQRATTAPTPDFTSFAGQTVRSLDHGELAGRLARTWVAAAQSQGSLSVGPGLWVQDETVVVRLSGDLTPYEFWQVANSLQPNAP